jgi:hypothetical protein
MSLGSNGESRKRLNLESYSLRGTSPGTAKRQKLSHPQSPSTFWDNLSKVWLTRNALRELDRRNNQRTIIKEVDSLAYLPANDFLHHCSPQYIRRIQRYARLGGPDLSGLRGVCSYLDCLE